MQNVPGQRPRTRRRGSSSLMTHEPCPLQSILCLQGKGGRGCGGRLPIGDEHRHGSHHPPTGGKGRESAHARHGGGADVGGVSRARPWPLFFQPSPGSPRLARLSSQSLAASRFHSRARVGGRWDGRAGRPFAVSRQTSSVERRSGWFFVFSGSFVFA